jgi:peptidoglycan hydrolase-like protein with peptidoglycan-binding domain
MLLIFSLLSTGLKAQGYVSVDRVEFLFEQHGKPGTWTQLKFKVIGPMVNWGNGSTGRLYPSNSAEFTLDSAYNHLRTDLRYRNDWLVISKFESNQQSDMYLGSRAPNMAQRRDLSKLSSTERLMAAWIIANTDELIEFALKSKVRMPVGAIKRWTFLAENDKFERSIRRNLEPYYRKEIATYDLNAEHTKSELAGEIQPNLKALGYYKGKVDGLWGSQTKSAILAFERDNNLFPDGVNKGKERQLLKSSAEDVESYSNIPAAKRRIEALEEQILRLRKIIADQKKKIEETEKAKGEARDNYEQILRLRKIIADQKKNGLSSEQISKLYSEIDAWRSKALKTDALAKNRYSQIVSLGFEIKELKADLAKTLKSGLSDDEKTKLLLEIESWKSQASEQKDLAKNQLKQIVLLNQKIAELRQEMSSSEANIIDSEILNEKIKLLTSEVNFASKQQKDAEAKHQRLQADLIKTHQAELKSLAASLKKEITNLKSELADANSGTTSLPKFELDDDWIEFERYLAVQQVRFCQILLNYREEAVSAADSRNQLRQNMVSTNRDNDIAALLPSGNYKDWVVKVVEIYATPTGDAAFVLRLPCDVTFGSGQLPEIGGTDGEYAATAEYGGIIYNQLAQLAEGDTVLISGKILTYSDIGNTKQRLNFVTTLVNNQKFKSSPTKDRFAPDYFSSVNYLSKL